MAWATVLPREELDGTCRQKGVGEAKKKVDTGGQKTAVQIRSILLFFQEVEDTGYLSYYPLLPGTKNASESVNG